MKPGDEDARRALAHVPRDYDVGYGKPPADTRFQKGQSGNPRGRPKGARNRSKAPALNAERMKAILFEEAYRSIKVNDGPRQVTVPMAQAVIRSVAVNAVKGNQRAQRLFTQLLGTAEKENKRLHDEFLDTAITYKVEWERELARRERLGIAGPAPLPHPDHVLVNIRSGEVRIAGPATKEEKLEYDELIAARGDFQAEIKELRQLLADEPDYPYRHLVLEDIAQNEKLLAILDQALPADKGGGGKESC